MSKRIVITGMGTVNPLGNNVADFWKNIKNAENGVEKITKLDVTGYPSQVGAEVKNFDFTGILEKKEARRMDDFTLFSVVSALEAMDDSGIKNGDVDPERMGVIIGNGIGGINTLSQNIISQHERGNKAVYPLLIPKMIINIAAGSVAIKLNAQGPNYGVVTACSSGTDAIGNAMKWISEGAADVMIAGGTEAPFHPIALAGFCALQALSTKYNDRPELASRPFDKDRDGFIMGEGAGIIVLEDLEHAKKRGAKIYAEVAGYGATCDANHLTAPHPEGRGAIAAMKMAVRTAGLQLEDIDYINAHGTSTPLNDPTETKAIKAAFGDHAGKLKVSSTKSMTGHLLGGAGGIEAIISAMVLKEQFLPPTRNYTTPDPECDLDYVPNKGQNGVIRASISNSLGFGGHNGVLCFKRYEE